LIPPPSSTTIHRLGGGIKQITAKTVDFGASDAILTDEQYKAVSIQMLPIVAGAVVPVYNVKEVTQASSSNTPCWPTSF
jgi:phosphate transport system substrate-binding protein